MNYYLIVPAGDLQSMDFSELLGTPETQRLSLDGTQAIVEREIYLEGWLTHDQARAVVAGPEWTNPDAP